MKLHVNVKLDDGAKMPTKAHPEADAGYDLYTPYEFTVKAGESAVVMTGVHMVIPRGWCGLLVSKSGLYTRHDIQSTGLVDADYTGSIVVKLTNHGMKDYHFDKGDKISQIVILPVCDVVLEEVDYLPDTERGANGFGSSGRR
jgi:dUTP pyrophosphatase